MKKLCSILLAFCMATGLPALTVIPAVAEEIANPYEPPANLDELSQAEQLAYFNLVVNRVREKKPGFRQVEILQITSFRTSIAGGAADGLVNGVVKKLMPGDPQVLSIAPGQTNVGRFMSENANASDLRLEDIISISSTKEGDNWVIGLLIKEELNPAKGLSSAHCRIMPIATRDQIVAELAKAGVTANVADATIRYYESYANITVNDQGKVILAGNGFQVDAQANNVKIAMFNMNVGVAQNSKWQCSDFDWDTVPEVKWWENLPGIVQWILRWVFFGWIWMGG